MAASQTNTAADPTGGDDPAVMASDDPSAGAPQGYCIEIHVKANGSITVEVEPEAEEAQEEGAAGAAGDAGSGEDDSDSGTPVKDIKAALTMALDIYRNDGQAPGEADDSFQSGFGDSSGPTAG